MYCYATCAYHLLFFKSDRDNGVQGLLDAMEEFHCIQGAMDTPLRDQSTTDVKVISVLRF